MSVIAEPIVEQGAKLGEGALWHLQGQRLFWVDILGQTVFVYDPINRINRSINVARDVGTIVPRRSGGVMLAVKGGFVSLDLQTEEVKEIAMVEADKPGNRFNDGKCDPGGRFWAGTMAYDFTPGSGSLYCMDDDLSVRKALANVTISNGLVWTQDETTMYYIDSGTSQIAGFDYDKRRGVISNRRTVVEIPAEAGVLDGMCIDVNANLWVAIYGEGEVRCWAPSNGELLEKVEVPGAKLTTSCAFGGRDLDELYITSASEGLTSEEQDEQPQAGSLFVARPGVTGMPAFEFEG